MNKLSLRDLDLKGKKVVVRVDFNVPLDQEGKIADDTRIQEALPSIQYILDQGGSAILMSHLGRPKGKKELQFSLKPCAEHLSLLLHRPVLFASDCIGKETEKLESSLRSGQVLLLENLRFYPQEENPDLDPTFAQELAKPGDYYVNDAFGAAHRHHSSITAITQYFPSKAAAGFLMEKELSFLSSLLKNPKRPFYVIIGGSKVSSKIGVLKSLLSKIDGIFIGGGMAFTFFKAQGISIGRSTYEEEQLQSAQDFLKECEARKILLSLPKDIVIADTFQNDAHSKTIAIQEGIPNAWFGMDIGPQTIEEWKNSLKKAQTLFWNGPLGVFEFPRFAAGTYEIAKTLSEVKAVTVVGGGDSVAAISHLHLSQKFSHVSTGGGASLEFLEQEHLPGIDALSDKSL